MDNSTPSAPTDYAAFLTTKAPRVEASGFEPGPLNPKLYPFQQAIVAWALKQGRAAMFEDCGLGKGPQQLEWAKHVQAHTGGIVLMVAPIAVGAQLIEEGKKFGVHVERAQTEGDLRTSGIFITNYERLHHFTGAAKAGLISGIVLDESSILKNYTGKTRSLLIEEFSAVPYRLCCTATPAPNDVSELANHAEFLGAMSRPEMLATFFVHDSDNGEWRLKGHAADDMWRWMAHWAVFLRRPSDLGFADDGWQLPPLSITDEVVRTGLDLSMSGVGARFNVRRATLESRVQRAVEILRCPSVATIPNISADTTPSDESSGLQPQSSTAPSTGTIASPTCASTTPRIETLQSNATPPSAPNTGSVLQRLLTSQNYRTDDARSAAASLKGDSASTMTIGLAQSEGSSAQPATMGSDPSTTIPSSSEPLFGTSSAPQWLVWCGLNDEESALAELLGSDCVVVNGQTSEEDRIEFERRWRMGQVRILVTKPKVFGWGLNWQHCSHQLFLGLGDSYEAYYQAIRRSWRFGQTKPVDVRIVVSDVEGVIAENVRRKEAEAANMAESIVAAVKDHQTAARVERHDIYEPKIEETDDWSLMLGDSAERLKEIPTASVGFSVFSPPFASLFTYSASIRDLGNCRDYPEFFTHYGFIAKELLRVLMPGRRIGVHCQDVATSKATHGHIGLRDFPGALIKAHEDAGFIFDGRITIDKNPQAQAIRTKSKQLMFVQKNKDSSWSRPALADYILLFRHPEETKETPVLTDVTNEEWILFAHPIWYGIRESDVLKTYRNAREDEDEKHICPLQLETIERCIRLWSNPGDVVLSPFAGIGSEGYVARRFGRKFIGIELKDSYWRQAVENIRQADAEGIRKPTEAVGLADIVAKQEAKGRIAPAAVTAA